MWRARGPLRSSVAVLAVGVLGITAALWIGIDRGKAPDRLDIEAQHADLPNLDDPSTTPIAPDDHPFSHTSASGDRVPLNDETSDGRATHSGGETHERQTPWRNPKRDHVRVQFPQLPGITYHRSLLPSGSVDQSYLDDLEGSPIFNPRGVALSPAQEGELQHTLGRLLAGRDAASIRASELSQSAVNHKIGAKDFVAQYDRPFPDRNYLYQTFKKNDPNIEWAMHFSEGRLAIIVLRPEEHPEVFEARRRLAASFDVATEYVFSFFESATGTNQNPK